jgi:hypothetical protein
LDSGEAATLAFGAQGTTTSSDNQHASITNGTFKAIASCDEQKLVSGSIHRGQFTNNSGGESLALTSVIDLVHNFTEPCIPERCAAYNVINTRVYYIE